MLSRTAFAWLTLPERPPPPAVDAGSACGSSSQWRQAVHPTDARARCGLRPDSEGGRTRTEPDSTLTTGAPSLAQEGRNAVACRRNRGRLTPHSSSERHHGDDDVDNGCATPAANDATTDGAPNERQREARMGPVIGIGRMTSHRARRVNDLRGNLRPAESVFQDRWSAGHFSLVELTRAWMTSLFFTAAPFCGASSTTLSKSANAPRWSPSRNLAAPLLKYASA